MPNLILASSSPRRQELLAQLGLQFRIISPDIDERLHANETAADYVARLAQSKAQAVLQQIKDEPNVVIIAADTTVAVDNEILAKPDDQAHAFAMWHKLSGRWHDVWTGVCVATATQLQVQCVQTKVQFCTLSEQDMQRYWATGEPIGKAGAYAIQGIAAQFIPQFQGSYSNVVGLPLYETVQMLKQVGVI
ncbi:MAG: Maf family nucleotide pyrophosphatase [Acinetobacter sp.]|nr:Maf family nucleotide pyrophosphatase [Acinetobacter sp.]